MDLSIRHQTRHTKSDIKEFTENYSWKIISILHVIMKVPLLNFVGGPGVSLLNFEGGPEVPLLNFRGVPGPTFKL